ncbi:MAG: hypothetical protein IID41_04515 [Planctomycetes bacterium]|nr:hypothetical protein [Planctomycetota bacterium]
MAIRSREQRQEDAERILSEYRARLSGSGGEDREEPSLAMPTSVLGKITQVVGSDLTYGPHLVVQPQEYTGAPPSASDSITNTLRCYPTPNHVVGDYAVNEFVTIQILAQSDAYVAAKLG